ncbi:MAG: winged helix DNA-binding domain-containing protein [Gammaproteobacteria bacterium]|nr:winged helix DNA-binding domain-containing protein [Gammaproteobacteria bacterium]
MALSIAEARKLALLSQWPPGGGASSRASSGAMDAALAAIRHLGYVQIDTISVVERAHHHTLWNRARGYRPAHLAQLLADKNIFEYWSHAAAVLPVEDYRFSLPRMRAIAAGQRHWYAPDRRLMKKVLRRITDEGPLRARDFESKPGATKTPPAMWDWKPAKRALEQLFMEGKLMVARRDGFSKVYDLAARVLPAGVDTTPPAGEEYARFLVRRFLRANGLGRAEEVAYLRGGIRPAVTQCMARMAKRGDIVPVQTRGRVYYALPEALELLERRLTRKRVRILSPFDNLLIQRERMRHLFDFDYRIECYTPAAARRHGYFSLPVLWDGRLVARMDCKAERASRRLLVRNFVSEPCLKKKEAFTVALADALLDFAAFNACDAIEVEPLRDKTVQQLLRRALIERRG